MFKYVLKQIYKILNTPIILSNKTEEVIDQQQESSVIYEVLGLHGVITYISNNEYKCKLIKTNGNTISNIVIGYNNAVSWLYKSAEYINEFD